MPVDLKYWLTKRYNKYLMSVLRYNQEYHAMYKKMLLYASISWCCYQLFCSCEKYVLYEMWQGNRCQFEKICEILGESNVRALVENFMSNFLINFACARLYIFLLFGLCKPVFAWMDAVQTM